MTTPRPPFQRSTEPATEAAVRGAVAGMDCAVLVTLTREAGAIAADVSRLDSDSVERYGHVAVLQALADLMGKYPGYFTDVYGYALALPEHDIAYLHTTEDVSTIAIGPNPHDDPHHRYQLTTALKALVDAGPNIVSRSTGNHPFPTLGPIQPTGGGPTPRLPTTDVHPRRHR
jgi:hypothetical protein